MATYANRHATAPVDLTPLVRALASVSPVNLWGVTGLEIVGSTTEDWCDAIAATPRGRMTVGEDELLERLTDSTQVIEATLVALRDPTPFLGGATVADLVDNGNAAWALIVEDGEWLTIVARSGPAVERLTMIVDGDSAPAPDPPDDGHHSDPNLPIDAERPIPELAVVRLRRAVPDLGLAAGELGTVVIVHDEQAYEVEFVNDDGSTRVLDTFQRDQLDPAELGSPTE